jgi:hypothetical protein
MLNIQLKPMAVSLAYPDAQDEHLEICRLLAAATVNPAFCRLLLDDPEQALRTGYQGESFLLTRTERDLVLSIGAASLESLAWELCRALGQRPACIASSPVDALQGIAI